LPTIISLVSNAVRSPARLRSQTVPRTALMVGGTSARYQNHTPLLSNLRVEGIKSPACRSVDRVVCLVRISPFVGHCRFKSGERNHLYRTTLERRY
jgi:hypothetical protein